MDDEKTERLQVRIPADMAQDMAHYRRWHLINWSDYVRRCLRRKINQLDKERR